MNEFLKSIKRFKFKSVFIYFYTHIFLVALIMCVVFSAYIYKTYIQNFSNNHKMTLNAFLTQSAEETDNSIKMLYETVLSLSKDPTIATSVVVPSFERIERNIETAQRLYTTAKNFDYINKIYLYESTNQMLFTSDETIEDFANSKHKNFVTKCLTDKTPYFDSTTRQSSKIISENGKLYMVCHFLPTPEKYLSTLIVEINSDRLFSGIKTTADETEYIIKIADRNDNSLFCTNADFDNKNIEQIEIISDYTNWKYIVYSPKTLDYSFGTYIKSILPFVVFVLFLGILVSFMVTASVYSPINKLVFFVEESEKNKNTDKIYIDSSDTNKTSEFDILAKTYTQLSNSNKATEMFINEVRPELESKLIMDIIGDGSKQTEESVAAKLQIINSNLKIEGKYQVFIIKLSSLPEESEQLIYYMIFKQLQNQITDVFRKDLCDIYFPYFNEDTFSIVVQYSNNLTVSEISHIQNNFIYELKNHFTDISEEITIAYGSIENSILSLPSSYYEAKENLKKLIYYGNEKANDSSEEHDNSSFDDTIKTLQNVINKGDINLAKLLTERFISELCVSNTNTDVINLYCSKLLDILLEKIFVFPGSNESLNAGYKNLYIQLENINNIDLIRSFMEQQTFELYDVLMTEYSKSQHKLIARAKEYMQTHYSDSSLSINQIADSVGISDTYLSSLFTEYTGENLVTYLNHYRVDMAKELLLNTKIMIKDVGFKTGFYTVQNFNRVFKRYVGMTPGDFRKNNK